MIIRQINENDAEAYLEMLKTIDGQTEYMMFEPGERKTNVEEMRTRIRNSIDSNSLTLVAEIDGNMVGFLSASRGFAQRIQHSAYIVIGILDGNRGKGIGTKLFEQLEKWANETGITRLELTVMVPNEHGVNLYKKMGFQVEGIKERSLKVNGEYVDEYYMAKLL